MNCGWAAMLLTKLMPLRVAAATAPLRATNFLQPPCLRALSSTSNVGTNMDIHSAYRVDNLPNMDIVSYLFPHFQKWSSLQAVVSEDMSRSYTYEEVEKTSLRWGAFLLKMNGGKAPDCVAILAPNIPEYFAMLFGSMAVGSTVTTINASYTPSEIARQLDDSGASVLICDSSLEKQAAAALKLVGRLPQEVLVVVNGTSFESKPNFIEIITDTNAPQVQPIENHPDKIALLPYSSGTTGVPKGVCLPHKALSNYIKTFLHPDFFPYGEATGPEDQQSSVGLTPFYHSFGLLVVSLPSLFLGSKIICMPKFVAENFIEVVKKHKVRLLHLVPPLLHFLVHSPLVTPEHLASVKNVIIAGAPVHPTLVQQFKKKVGTHVHFQEGYGMTEVLAVSFTPLSEERPGSCGRLLPNVVARLVDPMTGRSVGPDTPGELWIKTPSMLSRYHKQPGITAATMDEEGFLHTGDVATVSSDGFFRIVDRLKELIKVKGYQVSPTEVEEVLMQLPMIEDVGVVGVADEWAGELPRAYIVLKPSVGADEKALDEIKEKIHKHVQDKLAPFKKLAAGIVFLKKLPKNNTGKLIRNELKRISVQG